MISLEWWFTIYFFLIVIVGTWLWWRLDTQTTCSARFVFKLADLWVGAYWRKKRLPIMKYIDMGDGMTFCVPTDEWCTYQIDIWVCLLPTLPLHIVINHPQVIEDYLHGNAWSMSKERTT